MWAMHMHVIGLHIYSVQIYKKNPTFPNFVGLFLHNSAILHLQSLGRVVGFDGLGLDHAARVTALVVLAAGGHRAGNIAARQGADAHGKNE